LVGYPTKEVEIARQERSVGETKYNRFFGGVKTAMIAIYGYTNVIQKLFLGLSLFFFSNLALFVLTFLILDLTPEVTPKILFCVLMILGFSVLFVISLAAWLMTSYLDRIYKQSLNRPNYTIAYSVGFND
jgi:hypothetical protein